MYCFTSLGVVCSSAFYFVAGYWNFYSSLKSNFYYLIVSSDEENLVPSYDDLHFWLSAASFLSVVVLALFSLAALAVICADRCLRSKVNKFRKTHDIYIHVSSSLS